MIKQASPVKRLGLRDKDFDHGKFLFGWPRAVQVFEMKRTNVRVGKEKDVGKSKVEMERRNSKMKKWNEKKKCAKVLSMSKFWLDKDQWVPKILFFYKFVIELSFQSVENI